VNMVNPYQLAEDLDSIEVIHSEYGAALVHVAQEPKASAFASRVVPDEVDVDDLPILGEHADDVSLRHFIRKTSQEDPGRVLVLLMPRILRS